MTRSSARALATPSSNAAISAALQAPGVPVCVRGTRVSIRLAMRRPLGRSAILQAKHASCQSAGRRDDPGVTPGPISGWPPSGDPIALNQPLYGPVQILTRNPHMTVVCDWLPVVPDPAPPRRAPSMCRGFGHHESRVLPRVHLVPHALGTFIPHEQGTENHREEAERNRDQAGV